jgi:hypothetical protein
VLVPVVCDDIDDYLGLPQFISLTRRKMYGIRTRGHRHSERVIRMLVYLNTTLSLKQFCLLKLKCCVYLLWEPRNFTGYRNISIWHSVKRPQCASNHPPIHLLLWLRMNGVLLIHTSLSRGAYAQEQLCLVRIFSFHLLIVQCAGLTHESQLRIYVELLNYFIPF